MASWKRRDDFAWHYAESSKAGRCKLRRGAVLHGCLGLWGTGEAREVSAGYSVGGMWVRREASAIAASQDVELVQAWTRKMLENSPEYDDVATNLT